MDVHVGEMATTVHSLEGDALVDPRTLDRIVRMVLRAIDERQARTRRMDAERAFSGPPGRSEGGER